MGDLNSQPIVIPAIAVGLNSDGTPKEGGPAISHDPNDTPSVIDWTKAGGSVTAAPRGIVHNAPHPQQSHPAIPAVNIVGRTINRPKQTSGFANRIPYRL